VGSSEHGLGDLAGVDADEDLLQYVPNPIERVGRGCGFLGDEYLTGLVDDHRVRVSSTDVDA
jgi:hypothetical protein